jgi:hypothetical protein
MKQLMMLMACSRSFSGRFLLVRSLREMHNKDSPSAKRRKKLALCGDFLEVFSST